MLYQLTGWSVLSFFILLFGTGPGAAGKTCEAFSEVGTVIQLGSSFGVYCVFDRSLLGKCRKTIHRNRKEILASEQNTTTLFVKVDDVTGNLTFACKCGCCSEPCGLDLIAGYPPEIPQNLTCTQNGEQGNITCTWNTGRQAFIETTSNLWITTNAHNGTMTLTAAVYFHGFASATFPVFGSQYTVWATSLNKLGSVTSKELNFTLYDIVKPHSPDIVQVECTSWYCLIRLEDEQNSQLLQVQHRTNQRWITHTFATNTSRRWNISDLEPYTRYEFQSRCKFTPERGVWSEWSKSVVTMTDEEVPLRELDLWYVEEDTLSENKLFTLHWKKLSAAEARGQVLGYKVKVEDLKSGRGTEINTHGLRGGPFTCSRCNFTVTAFNSRGSSPPARIALPLLAAEPSPQNVDRKPFSNLSIAISWQRPATMHPVRGFLVEWFVANGTRQDLKWRRLGPDQLHTTITGTTPCECYDGAVYAVYNRGMGKQAFLGACAAQSAPAWEPQPEVVKDWGNFSVSVYWAEVPEEHRGGCLRGFNIYLQGVGFQRKYGPMATGLKEYTMKELPPGDYQLWMTVRTTEGDGPKGESHRFQIKPRHENKRFLISVIIWVFGFLSVLTCLFYRSAVLQRLSSHCPCLIPAVVPDPANSTWAKKCLVHKGQMALDTGLDLNTMPGGEEPQVIEIQDPELPLVPGSPQELLQAPPAGEMGSRGTLNPPSQNSTAKLASCRDRLVCPYIKSLSQEPNTHPSGDYIFSQDSQGSEERQEDEEQLLDVSDFFPCPQSPFTDTLVLCGGKLTLDAIKVNGKTFSD